MSRRKIIDLLTESHSSNFHGNPLQRLLHNASNQTDWTKELQALLPDPIRRDCRVASIQGTQVNVVCNNAASATRLRFLLPELVPKLKNLAQFAQVENIRIRVSQGSV